MTGWLVIENDKRIVASYSKDEWVYEQDVVDHTFKSITDLVMSRFNIAVFDVYYFDTEERILMLV